MIYDYECQKCGRKQEKWHKLKEKNEEPCENEECKAGPEYLKKLLACVKPHGTWSRWHV